MPSRLSHLKPNFYCSIFYFILLLHYFLNGHHLYIDNFLEDLRDLSDVNKANVEFSLRNPSQPDDDVCYIVCGKPETLSSCNFKNTSKPFCGLFESWVEKLVAALYNREKDANVIVVDWLDIQMYLYTKLHQMTEDKSSWFGNLLGKPWLWIKEIAILLLFFLLVYYICVHSIKCLIQPMTHAHHEDMTVPTRKDYYPCEHERSVHLFIDSLLNEEEASRAYSCGSNDMFDRGMCLQCHKNRCNTVGYDASKVRKARSVKMFIKTRGSMPFRVFHYQLKINFLGKLNQLAMEPALTVSLYGTNGEAEHTGQIPFEKITANKTYSFLVVTEKDSGDLLMLKFKLEESTSSLLSLHSSWWYGDSANSGVQVHKIRVRAGETQNKYVSNIFTRYSEHKKLSYTSNSHF
uniref:PLAT domain-containing protein n=1 Tax=Sinocyclocheilus anshuiensis TaxID=1608454 RepID=A0A671STV4_9TELE